MSLALDEELSELEHRLLAAHVGGCAECAAYARGVRAATAALRATPAERPAKVVRPAFPRRSHVRAIQVAAAAAAIAAAVGLGSLAGTLTGRGGGPSAKALARVQTQQPYVEQKLLAMLRTAASRRADHGAIPS